MRISLIGPSYPYRGGISHYTTLLYRTLRKKHQVRFFSFLRQYPGRLFPGKTDIDNSKVRIEEEGVELTIDSLNPITWIKTSLLIKKSQPRLLILPWWNPFWTPHFLTICYILKFLSKAKILFICHNVLMHKAGFFDRLCLRSVLSKGDYFIVHSQKEREHLLDFLPGFNVKAAFHPIYEIFRYRNPDKAKARKELGVSGKILLFFGFVREYKGLKCLLKAIPNILEEMEDITLLIVGEFWQDKSVYLDLITKLDIEDKVKIFDQYIPNEEVQTFFDAADLAVFPYVSVTGSGAVQTALGFDKPVITTNIGSLPEMVLDGKTGYIVNPGDINSLADAILKFFQENKKEEFIANIMRRKGQFSWDRLVEVIESF